MRVDSNSQIASNNQSSLPMGDAFTSALGLARRLSGNAGKNDESPMKPGDQGYENTLNSLAVELADGIDIKDRKIKPLRGDAAKEFQKLVSAELHAQRERGDAPDLEAAIDQAKDNLFNRIGNALDNAGRNSDKGLDVFEGYWKRHGGEEDAIDAGYEAYKTFVADTTLTDNPSYEDNLNALASAMAGGTLTDSRNILHLDASETLSQLYRNLIKDKLDTGLEPDGAREKVNEDLRSRIGGAAGDDSQSVLNVFDGYWSRHGGEDDAKALTQESYLDNRDQDDIDFDDTLNSLAHDMAEGVDIENRKVAPLTGEAGDKFRQLVAYQLEKQHERGESPDLGAAIEDAKEALFGRLGGALDNAGKDSEDGLDVFSGYWDRHGGDDAARREGYAAYTDFLDDATVMENPDYEDNLNALALGIAGGTLTDSRNIVHLDSSEALSQLYQNLLDHKVESGMSVSDAKTAVDEDLRERLGGVGGDKVVNVFDGYWERHGGENDAQRLTDNYDIDTARREHDLPAFSDTDIQSMETSEKDPDDGSRNMTVSELTWKTMVDDWKAGIEDGSIAEDDERAQFYRALRAQGALEDGLDLVGLDISEGLSLDRVTGDDMSSVIDGDKLEARLGTLFSSEAVQKDYQTAQTDAIDKVVDKDAVASRLEEMAFSEAYIAYIADLKANGQGDLAEADISRTYSALSALFPATEDSDKAAEFAQSVQLDASIVDLDDLIENPDKINDANTATATQDVVKMVLTALKRAGVDIPRRTAESIDKFVNEFLNDQQSAKSFGNALQELGDVFQKNGQITQTDIDKVFSKDVYQELKDKGGDGMMSFVAKMNDVGALGSAGGLISLASGIYQLAGKGGTLADTHEERLAIAKEFISFFGASQHFVNLGSNIWDKAMGTKVNDMLGLSKTLPEIWSTDKPSGGSPFTEGQGLRFVESFEQIIDDAPIDDREKLSQQLDLSESDTRKIIEGMEKGYSSRPELPGASTTSRTFSSFLRVLDAGANVATGVMDSVLGGLMIKRGADSGDGATIAQGAITVAAGAFTTAGGGSAAAALRGLSFARAAAGPLFWVGAALTLATLPFSIVQDIKRTNALEGHEADLKDLIDSLDRDGLLTEDGTERYEFLEKYVRNYGQRDAPDDESIFDYRSDEYAFYLREGHIPDEDWDDFEHEDYAGDGDNLQTDMDRGSTVGS